MSNVTTANAFPVVSYRCQVIAVSPLSSDTFQVELASPVGTSVEYHAGQYLQLELDLNNNGSPQSLFYSVANHFDPKQARRLILFIQNGSEFADQVLKRLVDMAKKNAQINVTLPMGQAFLQTNPDLPHLLIAAGSGISKIKCITEEILKRLPDAHVNIYWSNKNVKDFYLFDEFQGWLNKYKNLKFTPVLEKAKDDWIGRTGYLYEVIQEDFEDLSDAQTYLCGSPQMVYGTMDKLKASGLNEESCYSDVFEYSPRGKKFA